MFKDQPIPSTSDNLGYNPEYNYNYAEYVFTGYGLYLDSGLYSFSLFPSEPSTPRSIASEDILENQDNILVDKEMLELNAEDDVDMFEGMPSLQDVSDDEDEGK